MSRHPLHPRHKRENYKLSADMSDSLQISSMKILIFLSVTVIICIGIQGQNLRLRAALLHSDWLNDVDGDNIPGQAGVDYPVHATVPKGTSFRCSDYDYAGYFGDVEADCQAYHVCFPDGRNASFLCVNGTVFHQRYFVCDWWFHFNCSHAPSLYDLNLFRKIPLPVLPPVQRRPFPGPIPQPKVDLPPPPPPTQRKPKSHDPNSIEKDRKKERNPTDTQNETNPNNKQNERDKKAKDTRRPPSGNTNPKNKYKNPSDERIPGQGQREDTCNCQCNA